MRGISVEPADPGEPLDPVWWGSLRAFDVPAGPGDRGADYVLLASPEVLPVPFGVAALMATLEASGSDVAVGAGPGGVPGGPDVRATTVRAEHRLLEIAEPACILWRRSALEGLGIDPAAAGRGRAAIVRMLLAATTVDVLSHPVVHRREPTGAPADRRHARAADADELAARLDELLEVGALLEDAARVRWGRSVADPELRAALAALPELAPATQRRIVGLAARVLEAAGPDPGGRDAAERLQRHLAARGLVEPLVEVVKGGRTGDFALPAPVWTGGRPYADLPYRTDPDLGVPADVYAMDADLVLRGTVDRVTWVGRELHVAGSAFIRYVDLPDVRSGRLTLALVRRSDGRRIELPVERESRPDVTVEARDAAHCYDGAGFRTVIDAARLRDGRRWRAATWLLEADLDVDVPGGRVRRTRVIGSLSPGAPRRPALLDVGRVRIVPATGRGTFAVHVDPVPAVATAVQASPAAVRIVGRLRRPTRPGRAFVELVGPSGLVDVTAPTTRRGLLRRRFVAEIPVPEVAAAATGHAHGAASWRVRLQLPTGRMPLRAASDQRKVRSRVDGGGMVEVGGTAQGRLTVAVQPARAAAERVPWVGDEVEVSGWWPHESGGALVLRSRWADREHVVPLRVATWRFTARWRPGAMPTVAGELPLRKGMWLVVVRLDEGPEHRLRLDPLAYRDLPARRRRGAKTFTLTEDDGALAVHAGPDLLDDERGPANQQRLRRTGFPAFRRQGLRDEVLFDSYESRAYADNARAVLEELMRRETGLRCRWVVEDGQTVLPAGVEAVRYRSRDYYEALARARYLVVPNYLPNDDWYNPPRGQVVVQTWHGAPFKRIALDNPRWDVTYSAGHEAMIRRNAARWDYLLSPNPPSTPILRRAFGYEGEMLETGYPRTDVFHAADRADRAATVRERLRLPAGRRVVLYAPTLRDDHRYGGNRFRLDLRLDLAAARNALGDDHVLLVRRHAKVVDLVTGVDGSFSRDVSLWPDVNELLLATDVLITDYSSLMFDFAVTGRPMLFFTYDLADYAGRLRGLYFAPDRVPGPHLGTSAEVVEAVGAADELRAEYDRTYRSFVEDFCVWDDGSAAARFVDQVFAEAVAGKQRETAPASAT